MAALLNPAIDTPEALAAIVIAIAAAEALTQL